MLLSNHDIKQELVKAKKLSILPLFIDNIKASSINLTASAHAWELTSGKSVLSPDNLTVYIYDT